ncbi:MAG: Dabb family protein [Verrucomicrobiaceae bacterium]|nr:Dabb family protein [Verrucomicrobiaceae bacterium]
MKPLRHLVIALSTAALLSSCSSCPFSGSQRGKIAHTVFVWLKKPGDQGDRQKLIAAAKKLKTEIPEVETVTVGQMLPSKRPIVDSTYDVGFVMRFANQAALDRYEQNPIHQKAVKEQLLPMAKKVQVYDFVID